MKTRNGFVSNSSTSSFIVLVKDRSLSHEELVNKSLQERADYHGEPVEDLSEIYANKATEYADEGKYAFMIASIEYGAEEEVEWVVKKLLKKLNVNKEISFDWGE